MQLHAPETTMTESLLKGGESYYGILVWFVDIGTHETTYMGEKKYTRQVLLTFEFPDLLIKDEQTGEEAPVVRSMKLTFSMAETANLRKHIEKWYGKQFESNEQARLFDFNHIMGKAATLDIMLSKAGKPFIDTIRKTSSRGTKPYNPIIIWGFDMGIPMPENLPEWILKLIMEAKEYNAGEGQRHESPSEWETEPRQEPDFGQQYSTIEEPDDIPF